MPLAMIAAAHGVGERTIRERLKKEPDALERARAAQAEAADTVPVTPKQTPRQQAGPQLCIIPCPVSIQMLALIKLWHGIDGDIVSAVCNVALCL